MTSFGTDNKTAAEALAFQDTARKQAPYISAFLDAHRGHNVVEFEVQDCTVISCEDCDEYIMLN